MSKARNIMTATVLVMPNGNMRLIVTGREEGVWYCPGDPSHRAAMKFARKGLKAVLRPPE